MVTLSPEQMQAMQAAMESEVTQRVATMEAEMKSRMVAEMSKTENEYKENMDKMVERMKLMEAASADIGGGGSSKAWAEKVAKGLQHYTGSECAIKFITGTF